MKKQRLGIGSCWIIGILYVIPVAVTIIKSMQYNGVTFTLLQYWELCVTDYTVLYYFWNSVFYSCVITFASVAVAFPLGFLFAKINFWGRDAVFFIFILVMMLPLQATLLPNYIFVRENGLLNTPFALILPMVFSPMAVFLFRQFISGIDDSILEYVLLDTSSVLQILWYVVLPLAKEAFFAVAVLTFCESWNMVEQVIIFTPKNEQIRPLSVMLTEVPIEVRNAGAVIYMFPIFLLFYVFRKVVTSALEKFRW